MTDGSVNLERDGGTARTVEAGEMTLRVERALGESTLSLYGEVDLVSASILDRELRQAIEESPKVVIDLSAVQFVDSTGLRSLVLAVREADTRARDLAVLRPPPEVAAMLNLTGADQVFRFLD